MGTAQKGTWRKVILLQKRAIRCVGKATYNDSVIPVFKKLHFLLFNELYEAQILKLMHGYVNKTLPLPIQELFIHNTEVHNYNTR